jgi:2-oxo-4-hydroxy-4-carboxy--5-ureidoimidazoline (OHCU) decarboxylase
MTRRFLIALRKLAHKKNRPVFRKLMNRAIEAASSLPEGEEELANALKELDRIARLRFDS